LNNKKLEWKQSSCCINLTAYGLTRCGATQNLLAIQVLASGTLALSDGNTANCLRLLMGENNNMMIVPLDNTTQKPENEKNIVSLKALLPVHTIGLVAVADGIGVVFVSFADCFIPTHTAKVLYLGQKKDTETGTSIEATISVSNHLVGFIDNHQVILINMATGDVTQRLPIPNLGPDERPWQLSFSSNIICVCTPESVAWLHSSRNAWSSSPFNAAVACAIETTSENLAILTALGDVVIVDAKSQTSPVRLKPGSAIEPFICMHTRDGIAAWGGLFTRSLRLLKAGGNIQEVNLR